MQQYTEIADTTSLQASLPALLNNEKTATSNNSGTVFPTTNLQVGMMCFRTDQLKLYQLKDATPTWTLLLDISSGAAVVAVAASANALNAANAYSGASFTASGGVAASGAQGFTSSTFAGNSRNPIWRFGNADPYGLSYFQGGAGNGGDTIGIHFGTATAVGSQFQFVSTGNFIATGNVTGASDERLKTNWRDLPTGFIKKLAVVKMGVYDRTDIEATQVGVSAQSLQALMPEAVMTDSEGMLSVAYGNAALAACIALAKEVTLLRAEVDALKA